MAGMGPFSGSKISARTSEPAHLLESIEALFSAYPESQPISKEQSRFHALTRMETPVELPVNRILTETEKRLVDCYKNLIASKEPSNNRWTVSMKTELVTLGHQVTALGGDHNFLACATPHKKIGAKYGEWLFDVVWYREQSETEGGNLLEVPLVAEIEWIPQHDSIDPDFQKLIVARVPIKLWVFWVNSKKQIITQFDYCEQQLRAYHGWGNDGVYLLLGFAKDGYDKKALRAD
jgi:hypothetical protein